MSAAEPLHHPATRAIIPRPESPESDYGSDLDPDTWDAVLSHCRTSALPVARIAVAGVDEPVLPLDNGDEDDRGRLSDGAVRVARVGEDLDEAIAGLQCSSTTPSAPPSLARFHRLKRTRSVDVERDQSRRASFCSAVPCPPEHAERDAALPLDAERDLARDGGGTTSTVGAGTGAADDKSPLERFRRLKPLSVTDIVTPAWCELQYWYSLTKYGRVRRTAAMKQGSRIHKAIEREVYTEVPVATATREDQFALRLWNIIQGLRTLRATGLTRELQVFGTVDGHVTVGVIDELSYTCPDPDLEQSLFEADDDEDAKTAEAARGRKKKQKSSETLPPSADQRTLLDFLPGATAPPGTAGAVDSDAVVPPRQGDGAGRKEKKKKEKTIYLKDVKTRRSQTLPKLGSQMRATQMQLMLYRRLLHDLAANRVDADLIFRRYRLDPAQPFSDTFLAQLASIDFLPSSSFGVTVARVEQDDEQDEPPPPSSSPDRRHDDDDDTIDSDVALDEILAHNTLPSLWAHMMAEYARTISPSSSSSSSSPSSPLSPLLTAEFRSSDSAAVLGQRTFAFDPAALDAHVRQVMEWWRGDRDPRGVEIEEVYKCKSCDFLESCAWRIRKADELQLRARESNTAAARRTEANGLLG